MENGLPKNWVEIKISELTTIVAGGTPKSSNSEYFGGDIPWITPADLSGYKEKYIEKGRRNLTELGLEKSSAKLLPKESVLFSSRAPIGYIVIAKNPISTNQGFKNLLPNKAYDSSFAYYYLKHIKDYAESQASGTTFKELSGKKMGELPFLLPPLSEQHRIVAKLDGLFGHLSALQARLARVPDLMAAFRQSVLTQAVTGNENWEKKPIKDFTTKVGSGSTPKGGSKSYKSQGIPLIRSMNVHFGGIKYEGLAYLSDSQAKALKNVEVFENDVLLNRV